MGKVICIDAGAITFNAIHSYGSQLKAKQMGKMPSDAWIPPAKYTYFNMILSALKRIGVDKEDKVIVCIDGRNSWRKAFLKMYKGQRKALRDKHEEIDWTKMFKDINDINEHLSENSDWHFLKFDSMLNLLDILQTEEGQKLIGDDYTDEMFEYDYSLEADDIQAVCANFYKDRPVVIVTCDKDIYQLAFLENVKIYSLNIKVKSQKGGYVNVDQPLKIVADKIRKGDISDNIIVTKEDNSRDEEIRELIINLLTLPKWVEQPITNALENLPIKTLNANNLPYPNSLGKKFFDIYKKDKVLDFEYCKKLQEKRGEARKQKARERYYKKKEEKKQ